MDSIPTTASLTSGDHKNAPYISNIAEARGTAHTSIAGKVVLLTGIGQSGDPNMWGNGAATARILCGNGAKVFGCDLILERAQTTRDRIRAEGGDVEVCAANVTKKADVQSLVKQCLDKYGRIDILVNNVGMSEKGGPGEMSEEVWDAQVDVNLKSVYLCCHEVIPLMEQQGGGCVVNVASIAGMRYIGKPQVAYAATKAAVIQFTQASSVIYAPKGIRINVVVPGLMNTPLVEGLAQKYAGGDVEGFKATRNAQVPMGRMGDPFDVANTAAFLCSDAANYITGADIVVDGSITRSTGRT